MANCDHEGRIVFSNTSLRFFFLHTFHFWTWFCNNAVPSIADVRHIITLTFSYGITFGDVKLYDEVRNVLCNQTREKSRFIFSPFFFLLWVRFSNTMHMGSRHPCAFLSAAKWIACRFPCGISVPIYGQLTPDVDVTTFQIIIGWHRISTFAAYVCETAIQFF